MPKGVEGERGSGLLVAISRNPLGHVAVTTLCKTKEATRVARLVLVHQAPCAQQLGDASASAWFF